MWTIIHLRAMPSMARAAPFNQAAGMSSDRPNIIWFMVDQMRTQSMSISGDPDLCTPNLDRMAREGVWYDQARSGFPLCCPARGSFLTGLYPHRSVPGHEHPLPPGTPTIADAFRGAGYRTAWYGKWHLDGFHEHRGRAALHTVARERRGAFDTWLGYENNNAAWDSWLHGHRDAEEVGHHRLPGFETGVLTDLLLEEITANRDRPFFACVSVQPPHDPCTAPAEALARHNPAAVRLRGNVPPIARIQDEARTALAGYNAAIEDIDRNVGRVLDLLRTLGIDDRTYVIFLSDHGDQMGSHGHFRKMCPYEESIRVPFLVHGGWRWAYRPFGPQRSNALLNHVDVAPTTLGIARLPIPAAMQGLDLSAPAVTGRAPERQPEAALLQCVIPTGHSRSVDLPWRGLVSRDGWKYVALAGAPWLMFDLNEDPLELVNLAQYAEAAPRRRQMNAQLGQLLAEVGDSFPLPRFAD